MLTNFNYSEIPYSMIYFSEIDVKFLKLFFLLKEILDVPEEKK